MTAMGTCQVALLLVLISTSLRRSQSVDVTVTAMYSLEYYICGKGKYNVQLEGTVLLLSTNITHYVGSGDFCVVQNLTNVIISSDTPGTRAEIVCNHTSEFSFFTNRGFACLNCINLTLSDLSFSQCGGVLSREALLYENSTKVPAYYGTNQSAVWLFSETLDLNLINITITDYYGFAVIAANSYGSPLFQSLHILKSLGAGLCSSQSNCTRYCARGNYTCFGSGVLIYTHDSDLALPSNLTSTHSLLVVDSLFKNNSYWSNHDFVCTYSVFQFSPDHVPLIGAGGLTVFFTHTDYQYQVTVDGCTIAENSGTIAGGMLAAYVNSPINSLLNITNTIFTMNYLSTFCPGTALSSYIYYSEAYISSYIANHSNKERSWRPLLIRDTQFIKHINKKGTQSSSTAYLQMVNQPLFEIEIKLDRVSFTHNGAFFTGICLLAETSYRWMKNGKPLSLKITDVIAKQNYQDFGEHVVGAMTNSSQFVFTRLGLVVIRGSSSLGSQFIGNNGSVIQAYASDIYLAGNITFKDNIASQGAAIQLKSNSHIIIAENSTILFQNNQAYLDGGAIYANEIGTEEYFCVIQVDSDKINLAELNINMTFEGNIALRSGPSTYTAPLQHCFQTRVHVFPHHLTNLYHSIFTFSGNTTLALTSPAVSICPCVNNTPDCAKEFPTQSVYPGDSITVSLIGIDSTGGSVFSQLNASFSKTDSTVLPLPGWWIKSEQEISTLYNHQCRNLTYTIYSNIPNHEDTGRLNFAVPGLPPLAYQNLSIKACPIGFKLHKGECICHTKIFKSVGCNQKAKTLHTRDLISWIGVIEGNSSVKYIGYAPFCPSTYCNSSAMLNMIHSNTSICLNNRNGVLCGSCQPGYSITLGPHICRVCSNYSLFNVLAYLGGGLLAVLVIFVLSLTLHLGTVGGIIFYANLSIVAYNTLETHPLLVALMEPFDLINLDQAFSSCLYDGMTMSVKLGLQLAFSFYLWLIVAVMLVIARCSSWVTKYLVQSSVQVLITLIHLSFSRMLMTVIEVFSFVTITTEDRQYIVWLVDGTIEYGKNIGHVILLCIATMVSVFVILPYLLVGTLGSFGLRYRWVNKLRPFIDAIHGPYKDNRRYWFGMRLVVLVVVYATYAMLRGQYPFEQQLFSVMLLVGFTVVQAAITPFKQVWVGILDTWVMFNAIMMASASLYCSFGGTKSPYLLVFSLLLVLVTALAVLVYHIVLLVKRIKRHLMPDTTAAIPTLSDVAEHESSSVNKNTDYQSGSYSVLREPLLSYID